MIHLETLLCDEQLIGIIKQIFYMFYKQGKQHVWLEEGNMHGSCNWKYSILFYSSFNIALMG